MNAIKIIFIFAIALFSCQNESRENKMKLLSDEVPDTTPFDFKSALIPKDKIIHKGTFTPDLRQYYYTISDKNYKNFDVFMIEHHQGVWTEPQKAFFNSSYDDHGMSFSPDGNTLYFSSTRPVGQDSIPSTWHLWKSDKINGKWIDPVFIDIPNLRNKLLSHPSISNAGTLFFHSSNLDYSEMDLYYSKSIHGSFVKAQKLELPMEAEIGKCTPFISPKEDYLIFAAIGNQLDLMICFKDDTGKWSTPKKLNERINHHGQGNPYVTPDNKFLFFTTGNHQEMDWSVKWVNIEAEFDRSD